MCFNYILYHFYLYCVVFILIVLCWILTGTALWNFDLKSVIQIKFIIVILIAQVETEDRGSHLCTFVTNAQRAADDSDPLWIREACSVMFCKNKPAHMPSDKDHIHFSITQLIVWCLMCQIMVKMSITVPKGQDDILKFHVLVDKAKMFSLLSQRSGKTRKQSRLGS